MDTKQVVSNYFNYINTQQWDKYMELFADDVIMDEQIMGHLESRQAVAEGIENLKNAPRFENHLVDMVVEGNRAMARWHIIAEPAPDVHIECDGVNYYEVENGKIVRFANYHDTAPFAAILRK